MSTPSIDPIELAKSRLTFDHLIPWDKIPDRIVAITKCDGGVWRGFHHTIGLKPITDNGCWESVVLESAYKPYPYWESLWDHHDAIRIPPSLRWDEHLFIRPSVTQDRRITDLEVRISVLEGQLRVLMNVAVPEERTP